jgi:hypothetical protein
MIPVRKYVLLVREVRPARVNEVYAWQPVLLGNLLRPQMFLDGDGIVGAAFDSGIVGHNDTGHTVHGPDASEDATGRKGLVGIYILAGEGREVQEWC